MKLKFTGIILLFAAYLTLPVSAVANSYDEMTVGVVVAFGLILFVVGIFVWAMSTDVDDENEEESYSAEEDDNPKTVEGSTKKCLDNYKENKIEYIDREKEIQLLTEKAQDLEIQALQKRIKELEEQLK